jgi:very-short-patch-repair endonuclease
MNVVREDPQGAAQGVWLRDASRELRRRSTPTERQLWAVLRGRRFSGRRFRRQHPIGPYIVDFLFAEAQLVIEIDGPIHESQQEYDAERDEFLRASGYRVLRISVDQVRRDLAGALIEIDRACQLPPHLLDGPSIASWTPPLPRTGEGSGGEGSLEG